MRNTSYYPYRDSLILDICRNKKVLHIGYLDEPYMEEKMSRGVWLHSHLAAVCSQLVGLDINLASAKLMMAKYGYEYVIADLNKKISLDFFPDVIVCGETIEHLTNMDLLFANLRQIMKKNTKLLISTPNAYSLIPFLANFFGEEMIHPEHMHVFTKKSLFQLLQKEGMEAVDFSFTNISRSKGIRDFLLRVHHRMCAAVPSVSETLLVTCRLA